MLWLILVACATDSELRAARESWRGATYDEVVAAWGPPNRIVKSGSQENHTWLTEEAATRAGSAGGAGGVVFGADGGGRCERTLMIRAGRVTDEDWTGDPEVCQRFARIRR